MLGSHQIAPAPNPAVKAQPGRVTAEWIDYVIQTPGKSAQSIRREIFDLIGPAARHTSSPIPAPEMSDTQKLERSLSLMDSVDILPLAVQPSPEFILHSSDESLLSNRASVVKLIRESRSPQSKTFANELANLKPVFPEQLNSFALARFERKKARKSIYLDQTDILTYHRRPHISRKGELVTEQGFDIVSNMVGIPAYSARDRFLARLEQGVLDTNVEAALGGPANDVQSTAKAFLDAGSHAPTWRVLRANSVAELRDVQLPADARARLREELRNGEIVVAPTRSAPLKFCPGGCWWQVNPQTGETLGIGNHGWGQEEMMNMAANVINGVTVVLCGGVFAAKFKGTMGISDSKTTEDAVVCMALGVGGLYGVAAGESMTVIGLTLTVIAFLAYGPDALWELADDSDD